MSHTQQRWTEEELITTLSKVLLLQDSTIDGLDEDLVAYISGLLSTQLADAHDEASVLEVLEESMVPFLESVDCPNELTLAAKNAILSQQHAAISSNSHNNHSNAAHDTTTVDHSGARKLKQGIVQMSSTLSDQVQEDANSFLWGSGEQIKANANVQKDAYQDKSSAKERRKQRQELEKARRELAAQQQQQEQASAKAGVSVMLVPTVKSKERDVNLLGLSLSLDNGTLLLEHGDLKFAYGRRYGLVSNCWNI